MPAWLFKTEPSECSLADLQRAGRTTWDGVNNPTALLHLREVRRGDTVFIYHTGDERAVVGVARAAGDPFEDPARPGLNPRGEPKFAVIDLEEARPFARPAPLAAIKADPRFKDFPLVTMGRLSVMPVPAALERALRDMGG